MPSSFNYNKLRAGALLSGAEPHVWASPASRVMPWRAHDKENSFAPAIFSQEQENAGAARRRNVVFNGCGAGCRSPDTT